MRLGLSRVKILLILVIVLAASNAALIVLYLNTYTSLEQYKSSYNNLLYSYKEYNEASLMLRSLLALELARTNIFLYVSSAYSYILSSDNSILHNLSLKLINNTKASIATALEEIDKLVREIEMLENKTAIRGDEYARMEKIKQDLLDMKSCLTNIRKSLDDGVRSIDDISNTLALCGSR